MTKKVVIIADYTTKNRFSVRELCEICRSSPDFIQQLVEYEIIFPIDSESEEWLFDVNHLQRVKTVLRLQRDLEVNLAGAAIVLDLLDELETLRARAALLEKHLLNR